MYKNGYAVPKNLTEAIKWFEKTADQGRKGAKERLQKLGVAGK